jgi:hypothetical protein
MIFVFVLVLGAFTGYTVGTLPVHTAATHAKYMSSQPLVNDVIINHNAAVYWSTI